MAENFVRANMGEQWMDMVPMIAALFSLSLGSSLLSLLGLWAPSVYFAANLRRARALPAR